MQTNSNTAYLEHDTDTYELLNNVDSKSLWISPFPHSSFDHEEQGHRHPQEVLSMMRRT